MRECVVISKVDSPGCKLQIRDMKIKQVQKFNQIGCVIIEKNVTEIQRYIGIKKVVFQKLSKEKRKFCYGRTETGRNRKETNITYE